MCFVCTPDTAWAAPSLADMAVLAISLPGSSRVFLQLQDGLVTHVFGTQSLSRRRELMQMVAQRAAKKRFLPSYIRLPIDAGTGRLIYPEYYVTSYMMSGRTGTGCCSSTWTPRRAPLWGDFSSCLCARGRQCVSIWDISPPGRTSLRLKRRWDSLLLTGLRVGRWNMFLSARRPAGRQISSLNHGASSNTQ